MGERRWRRQATTAGRQKAQAQHPVSLRDRHDCGLARPRHRILPMSEILARPAQSPGIALPTTSELDALSSTIFRRYIGNSAGGMSRIDRENELHCASGSEWLFSALRRWQIPGSACSYAPWSRPARSSRAGRGSQQTLAAVPRARARRSGLARELLQRLHVLSSRSGLTIFDPSQIPIGEPVHEVRAKSSLRPPSSWC